VATKTETPSTDPSDSQKAVDSREQKKEAKMNYELRQELLIQNIRTCLAEYPNISFTQVYLGQPTLPQGKQKSEGQLQKQRLFWWGKLREATKIKLKEALEIMEFSKALSSCLTIDASKYFKRVGRQWIKATLEDTFSVPVNLFKFPEYNKYHSQRYKLFSREGVRISEEGWFSITHEGIAKHQAERCACDTILDPFAGWGGNIIQFAQTCQRVVACDINPLHLDMAHHNAAVYKVDSRIEFLCADFLTTPAHEGPSDGIFLSPPWGGPDYNNTATYDLNSLLPINGYDLLAKARTFTNNVALYLPRNVDPTNLGALAGEETCEVELNFLDGKFIAITVYFGDFARKCCQIR
jgi:trimethylguanosine synthase